MIRLSPGGPYTENPSFLFYNSAPPPLGNPSFPFKTELKCQLLLEVFPDLFILDLNVLGLGTHYQYKDRDSSAGP